MNKHFLNICLRSLLISLMIFIIGGSIFQLAIGATEVCPSLSPGTMIKIIGAPAIFVLDNDLHYRYFANGDVFKSWHADDEYAPYYTKVSSACLATLSPPTRGPFHAFFRAGSTIVKSPASDQYYVVQTKGVVSPISKELAKTIYGGANGKFNVMTIGLSEWPFYQPGTPLTDNRPHNGSLIAYQNKIWYVEESTLREVTQSGMVANQFKLRFVHPVDPSAVASWKQGPAITGFLPELNNYIIFQGPKSSTVKSPNGSLNHARTGGLATTVGGSGSAGSFSGGGFGGGGGGGGGGSTPATVESGGSSVSATTTSTTIVATSNPHYLILNDQGGGPVPTPQFVAANIDYLKTVPIDGLAIHLVGPNDSGVDLTSSLLDNKLIGTSTINLVLAPLSNLTWGTLSHNFVFVLNGPHPDPFDDWSNTIANFRDLAKGMKTIGLQGIFFDNEDYSFDTGGNHTLVTSTACYTGVDGFHCHPKYKDTKSLAQYRTQLQLRGKQLMQAMIAEFPDIAVLSFHGPYISEPKNPFGNGAVTGADDLVGSFFVGLVEGGLGTKATVVDGGEGIAMKPFSRASYEAGYLWRKKTFASSDIDSLLVPPELRPKWDKGVSVGFEIYYCHQVKPIPTSPCPEYTIDPTISPADVTKPIMESLRRTDQYVWLYTEGPSLVDPANANASWMEAMRAARKLTQPPYTYGEVSTLTPPSTPTTSTLSSASTFHHYFLSTIGSDSADGSVIKPWASPQFALNKLSAGDTLTIREGTYLLKDDGLLISSSGSSTARILIQAFPGETAIFDGINVPHGSEGTGSDTLKITGDYIDIKGLHFKNNASDGIYIGGQHIRILENTVHHSQNGGIRARYKAGTFPVADVLIEGNSVFRSSLANATTTHVLDRRGVSDVLGNWWSAGVVINNATGVSIINNLVYENYGEGILCYLVVACQMKGNTVYDNFSAGLYYDNVTNSTMEKNMVYSTGNTEFFRFNKPQDGIFIANEDYTKKGASLAADVNESNNNRIVNNIVVGVGIGLGYGAYERGGGLKNTIVAYNTFYNTAEKLLMIESDKGHTNTTFLNNIFYQTNGRPILGAYAEAGYEPTSGISFHHNLWFRTNPPDGVSGTENVLQKDPLFVKAGGLKPGDYKLLPGSPALKAGIFLAEVTADFSGTPRLTGKKQDLGAHQLSTNAKSIIDSQVNKPTSNLQKNVKPVTNVIKNNTISVSPIHLPQFFHLAPDGSDAGLGTLLAPWKTLQKATSKMLPGDVLTVHGGTYYGHQSISATGTALAPITIMAASGEVPLFTTGLSDADEDPYLEVVGIHGAHIIVSGFSVMSERLEYTTGIYLDKNTHNITVANCNIYGVHGVPLYVAGNYNLIEYNHLHDNIKSEDSDLIDGLYVEGHHNTIRTNTIFNTWGNGIELFRVVDNPTINKNALAALAQKNGNNTIENNYIYHTGYGAVQIDKQDWPHAGIAVSQLQANNTVRYNRTCDNVQYGMYIEEQKNNIVSSNATCYNGAGGILVTGEQIQNTLQGNISYNDHGPALAALDGTISDYNTYFVADGYKGGKVSWQWNGSDLVFTLEELRELTKQPNGVRQDEHSQVQDPQFNKLSANIFDWKLAESYNFCTKVNSSWCAH